jgi:hypothetical protein
VNVLFCAAHFGYFRNFESLIVALAERGHTLHLAADESETLGGRELVERLSARYPGVTFGFGPHLDDEPWFRLARKLRIASDYVRFHEDTFATFRKTRQTLKERVPHGVVRLMDAGIGGTRAARRVLGVLLRVAERLMPLSDASLRFITAHRPDVVLVASVTAWRLPEIDHLRAASALGVRTGVCVFSWDHLSSKALLRTIPDRIFLWNETQKREAIDWHGMPPDRIVVTGAQCYDQWFGREPSRDRASFCAGVGLAPGHPILLYVCSVMTPNPTESRFVLRWIEEIRRSADPRLRQAGILVRPHPERMEEWEGVTLERFGNVALYGRNPTSPDAQADYFDSLFHSHAVIGLVTSAFLEAAIVGRPVHTLLLPEFEMYQEGVQHFRYLLEVEGGLLEARPSLPEHLAALAAALQRPPQRDEQNVRFLEAFVRPRGLMTPATPAFADAIERLAASEALGAERRRRAFSGRRAWRAAVEPIVHRIAVSVQSGWLRPLLRDAVEARNDAGKAEKQAVRTIARADRARRMAMKQRLLARRRQDRRREHRVHARRRHLARLQGQVRMAARVVGSGASWRKQAARLKGRLKALMGLAT